MKNKNRILVAMLATSALLGATVLTGCHTVAGAGRDVKKVGTTIERGATAMHP